MSKLGSIRRARIEPDRINLLITFVAVAERLSFAEAAADLNLVPSSVSRQIAKLESSLGISLFTRTTRRVALTEPGRLYFEECLDLLDKIEEMDQTMSAFVSEPHGTLNISAPIAFGRLFINRAIDDFQSLHEKLTVNASFTDDYVDLIAGGYDLVIRTGSLPDSSLIARRIATNRRRVVASPRYVANHGVPAKPEDLATHNCVLYTHYNSRGSTWSFSVGDRKEVVDVTGDYRTNSSDAVHQAALDGRGIALLADYLIHEDVQAGRLVQLLPNWESYPEAGIYVVYPPTKQLLPKVRAFIRFLESRFSRERWNLSRPSQKPPAQAH